jgi:Protein of unknown function (DUF3987)
MNPYVTTPNNIRPHPDCERLSKTELIDALADADERLETHHKAGADADPFIETWLVQERMVIEAELSRRNAINSHNSLNSRLTTDKKPVLESEALHGLVGEIVRTVDPYTESDPVAVLTNILTAFGNVVGSSPHFRVENTRHHLNLFIGQVGDTSKARKGTGWSTPKQMFKEIDTNWAESRITGGLSSGEGLIYAVRDQRTETKPIRERGRIVDYEQVVIDKGETDKRLLLIEEEFAQALKVMSREGNILSTILRQTWDGGNLNPLVKNNPVKATGAHISIIGHITKTELLRYLTATEQSNGFANRFCWFLITRSKFIANPLGTPQELLSPLIQRLRDAVNFARKTGEIRRDTDTEDLWAGIYPRLSDAKPGLVGSVISRAEAQVMRLACIYALLDRSELIRTEHLRAALALWDYSEKSATLIFGELTGDPGLDKAKEALKVKGRLTMTDLHGLFGRHAPAAEIERVARLLISDGFAVTEAIRDGNGRPATVLNWKVDCERSELSE